MFFIGYMIITQPFMEGFVLNEREGRSDVLFGFEVVH